MIGKINIKAPAKINIGLNVVSKRDDGFHNIETIFYPVKDLYDELVIEKSTANSFVCNVESVPVDESNLVMKAKRLLELHFQKELTTKIELQKNIPVGAGLGGGSSDAAAVLLAFNDLFDLKLNYPELVNLGLELGSDVPLFIKTIPAIGRGRGEQLDFIDLSINKHILLVNPGINISTKDAYANISPSTAEYSYNDLVQQMNKSIGGLKNKLVNDFETYAFLKYPEIKKIKNTLYSSGAELAMMTGSGSTVFGIFENKKQAQRTTAELPGEYFIHLSDPENYF